MRFLPLLLLALLLGACRPTPDTAAEPPPFTFSVWVTGEARKDDASWRNHLARMQRAGISDFFVEGSPERIRSMVRIGAESGARVHGWITTINRPGDQVAQQHPDWYAVNRLGQNSLEHRAYVDYYQWLSPFSPGAREHIKDNIRALAEIEGIASVHLDYVRFCDVILATGLQPKYDLVQDHEMPEFDYGYHPLARQSFEQRFGYDPLELDHPELSNEWRQWRLNAVTSLVVELADIAHQHGTEISAAVFPFPEMSRQMVRQDWDKWPLDLFLPMIYHGFYEQDLPWIGFCTEQGLSDLHGRAPLYSGLYLPDLNPDQLEQAIRICRQAGAQGVSLFDTNNLSDEHLQRVAAIHQELQR